jgi:hypothetical protein
MLRRICTIGVACMLGSAACRGSAEAGAPERAADFKGIATIAPPPPPTVGVAERGVADAGELDHSAVVSALKQKVFGGRASNAEARLLISFCKDDGDTECIRMARQFLE